MPSDNFATSPRKIDGPIRSAIAVTPSDSVGIDTTRAIFIGGAGNASLQLADDAAPVVFNGIAAGTVLPFRVTKVLSTNTTATLIRALY